MLRRERLRVFYYRFLCIHAFFLLAQSRDCCTGRRASELAVPPPSDLLPELSASGWRLKLQLGCNWPTWRVSEVFAGNCGELLCLSLLCSRPSLVECAKSGRTNQVEIVNRLLHYLTDDVRAFAFTTKYALVIHKQDYSFPDAVILGGMLKNRLNFMTNLLWYGRRSCLCLCHSFLLSAVSGAVERVQFGETRA